MSVTESISQRGGKSVSIPSRLILPAYTLAIFVSAFLLFSVQPLFAKMVLPKLGGSPAVWSVAMVFFQTMLLAGYLYAHLLTRFLSLRNASLIHMGVMITAFVFLPLAIPEGWTNPPESGQSIWLLGLFTMAVGLPFFAVAANSPLLQAWFSKTGHAHAADPYFLYGASNIGSFASLILYIVAFEPTMAVTSQSLAWTAGFALLAIMIGFAAMLASPRAGSEVRTVQKPSTIKVQEGSLWRQRLTWIALAFIPSGLLVAVTAHMSTDVAAAPFLWVIPLALFLLTFVVAFARKPIIGVKGAARVVFVLSPVLLLKLAFGDISYPWLMLPAHLVFFFFAALLAHSLLVAQRPRAERLTEFYL